MASLPQCYALSRELFPETKLKFRLKRLRYAVRLRFLHSQLIGELKTFFSKTPMRQYIFSLTNFRTWVYRQQIKPSFYHNCPADQRLYFLQSHFEFLEATHKEEIIAQIYSATIAPITFRENENCLSFRINYHVDVAREGLAWLLVEMNGEILYKITFWLMNYKGVPTLCIGSLQGGKLTLETNRLFTKEFWGLRPQNMALNVLRCYAKGLGVQQLYTFPKERLWCKKINEQTAISEFWQEQGATPVFGTPFIKIELEPIQKPTSEIPSRKRSMYKKRYEFMDRLNETLRNEFQHYLKSRAKNKDPLDQAA